MSYIIITLNGSLLFLLFLSLSCLFGIPPPLWAISARRRGLYEASERREGGQDRERRWWQRRLMEVDVQVVGKQVARDYHLMPVRRLTTTKVTASGGAAHVCVCTQ